MKILYFIFYVILNFNTTANIFASSIKINKNILDKHNKVFDLDIKNLVSKIPYEAKLVLLGESSHGTKEFYTVRSSISKELIQSRSYDFIAIEGDWDYVYAINKFIKNFDNVLESAEKTLLHNNRWPGWMWANYEFLELILWLKNYNLNNDNKIGIYGIDMQNPRGSIEVLKQKKQYLDKQVKINIEAVLACFKNYNYDFWIYSKAYGYDVKRSCEKHIINTFKVFNNLYSKEKINADERLFNISQNLLVVKYADKYFRSFNSSDNSWNIRVKFMEKTILNLKEKYSRSNSKDKNNISKGIVWAHNTHIGDASATVMKNSGLTNIGELLRHRASFIVGFATYKGTVMAARAWGAKPEIFKLPLPPENTVEAYLNKLDGKNSYFILLNKIRIPFLSESLAHRAIGVVYRPEQEAASNYVKTVLNKRYDLFIFIKETSALTAL